MHDLLILKIFYNNKGLNYNIFDKFIQNLSNYPLLFEYISLKNITSTYTQCIPLS